MTEKKGKKFPIRIKTSIKQSQGELNKPCETEINTENIKSDITEENIKPRITVITTEVPTHPKIVGQIPPWDDDDDSQQDDQTKPPSITTEIPCEDEKFNITPRATGEIPPWDDEEESKSINKSGG
ncbi:hypothetical protein [Rivularia sp. UHCC 0363]|uniref:hypothetical protein n=1 Tax=Rivularia sp. UHCC 0363 TaxID=3110244 RepID=UPI002B1FDEC9|nr:hypothetical protein [Rivularia sp. UHCC 0363]MEA5596399.1 hypothetical protein [Rivularia sp. UHCC 0363]